MSRTIGIDLLHQRHTEMLRYQKSIAPFTPTLRELMEVWNLDSTNTVSVILINLLAAGVVIVRQVGKDAHHYYAVEWKDNE
jgi:hypothetical protein